ncbi:(2Fe-2S)-binding protein [Streptomyces sp. NPDC014870]|uniref:(2Fe-2S)-binding protein n=1 Tax=Streptomyces sp. NPDC014870 TaxID=3364925 RepID=UPI0036FEB5E4
MDLVESSSVGGFFALRTAAPETAGRQAAGGHMPLARLYAAGGGPGLAPLTARVDRVGDRLGAPERRVAASIAHLGLAARLWSIALGPAALFGRFPDLDPAELSWDPALTSPEDLWWAGTGTRPATVADLREAVQTAHLVPLHEAFRRDGRISPRLLWGNAGSALAGALRELTRWAHAQGRPEVAARAAELVAGLFAHPDLARTVEGRALRRTSCCLYYRCPSGGLCGDCVFDHPPARVRQTGLETGPTSP